MKNMIYIIIIILSGLSVQAEDYKPEPEDFTPEQLAQVAKLNQEGREAAAAVDSAALGNPEHKKRILEISKDLMPWLVETTHGDEAKMRQLIEGAKRNPEEFYKRLPSNVQDKVTDVSNQIELQKKRQISIP